MDQEYENIVSSSSFLETQSKTLQRLYIEDESCLSGILAVKLNDLSQHYLPQLKSLELEGSFGVGFVIYILQILSRLETLVIKDMVVPFSGEEDLQGLLDKHKPIVRSSLKNLCIHMNYRAPHKVDATLNYTEQVNEIFQYMLESCPVLERIDLEGGIHGSVFITDGASLNFSLIDHFNIKEIRLSFSHCRYYALNCNRKYVSFSYDDFTRYNPSGGDAGTEETSSARKDPSFYVSLLYRNEATTHLALLEYPPRLNLFY